jgi:hypothetical protein
MAKGWLENTYDELLETDSVSCEPATGNKTSFSILLGTQGALRGVPVQIRYQSNWWFQVVLNLRPESESVSARMSKRE